MSDHPQDDYIEWGDERLNPQEILFQFSDDGIWQGPWIGRVLDDQTFGVKDLQTLNDIIDLQKRAYQGVTLIERYIQNNPEHFVEITIDKRQISEL